MDQRQALLAARRLLARRETAQVEHLRVPVLAAVGVDVPGADAGVARDERGALARFAQGVERAVPLGDVHGDAEDAARAGMDAVDVGAHDDPAHAAVAAQGAELDVEGLVAAEEVAVGLACRPDRDRRDGRESRSHRPKVGGCGGSQRSNSSNICAFQSAPPGPTVVVQMPTPAARDAASRRRASSSAWRRCSTRSVMSSATPTKAIGSPLSLRSTTRRVST